MALETTDANAFGAWTAPMVMRRVQVPKIPGLDTSKFQDWHWKDAKKRKAIHVMCDIEEIRAVQALFEVAKAQKMVETLWGKNVRISKVIPSKGRRRRGQVVEEVSSYTLDANKSYAMKHINYEASMVSTGIRGIVDVDKKMDIMSVTDPQEKKKRLHSEQSCIN